MERHLRLSALAAGLSLLLAPTPSSAWSIERGFEGGGDGEVAQGPDAFEAAGSECLYSSDVVRSGAQSAVSTVVEGSTAGGTGGRWNFPSPLREGDDVWFRVWVYHPEGYDFSCGCAEGIKFLRLFTRPGDGSLSTEGSWDYYLSNSGVVIATGVTGAQPEFYANHPWPHEDIRGLGGPISRGEWHAYELYVRLSATPGEGIIRAWLDGTLLFEDLETRTLNQADSTMVGGTLWTYWNNGAPQTQSAFVDDVVLTNERPASLDAFGNAMVGIGLPTTDSDAGPERADAGVSSDAALGLDSSMPDGAFADAAGPDVGRSPEPSGEHEMSGCTVSKFPDAGASWLLVWALWSVWRSRLSERRTFTS